MSLFTIDAIHYQLTILPIKTCHKFYTK